MSCFKRWLIYFVIDNTLFIIKVYLSCTQFANFFMLVHQIISYLYCSSITSFNVTIFSGFFLAKFIKLDYIFLHFQRLYHLFPLFLVFLNNQCLLLILHKLPYFVLFYHNNLINWLLKPIRTEKLLIII